MSHNQGLDYGWSNASTKLRTPNFDLLFLNKARILNLVLIPAFGWSLSAVGH